MNKFMKVLIPMGIGFCLGRTRILVKNLSEGKFKVCVDKTPIFVTDENKNNTIYELEGRIKEMEDYLTTPNDYR